MRVLALEFSLTGNTAAALSRVERKLAGAEFVRAGPSAPDAAGFDGVVLATPVLYRGVPAPFARRVATLSGAGRPALLVVTYGAMPGGALADLAALARGAGLRVVASHALLMPESYPPFVAKGWTQKDAPPPAELAALDAAIDRFRGALGRPDAPEQALRKGLFARLIGTTARAKAVRRLGGLRVDRARCTRCGTCRDGCPAGAIRWSDEGPAFDEGACLACFRCYNRCPSSAIDAGALRGRDGRYRPASLGVAARTLAETAPDAPGPRPAPGAAP